MKKVFALSIFLIFWLALGYANAQVTITNTLAWPTSCAGSSDGIIKVIASGSGALSYQVIDANGTSITQSSDTIKGLLAGVYKIYVTDSTGSMDSVTKTVIQPPPVQINISNIVPTSCLSASNGSVQIHTSGGNYNLYMLVVGGIGVVSSTTLLTGLAVNTYSATAVDAKGCTSTTNIIIGTTNYGATISCTSINSCFGSNGSLSVTTGGGVYPIVVSINGAAPQASYPPGNYTIVATDASNCTSSKVKSIANTQYTIAASIYSPIGCNITNGAIKFTTTGNPSGTINYSFTGPAGAPTPIYDASFSGYKDFVVGNYTVIATDIIGCSTTTTFLMTQLPAQLSISPQTTQALCSNANGFIDMNVVDTSGLNLAWTISVSPSTNATIIGDSIQAYPGVYTVIITDAGGCSYVSTKTITSSASIGFGTIPSNPKACNGGLSNPVTVGVSGNAPPFTLSWSPANGVVDIGGGQYKFLAGTYTLQATDANNCTASTTVHVSAATFNFTISSSAIDCINGTKNICVSSSAGNPNPSYTIMDTLGVMLASGSGSNWCFPFNVPTAATVYTVQGSSYGCYFSNTFAIDPNSTIKAHISILTDSSCTNGTSLLTASTSNSSGPSVTYGWLYNNVLQSGDTLSAVGTGPVVLYANDSTNCTGIDTVFLLANNAWWFTADTVCQNESSIQFPSIASGISISSLSVQPSATATVLGNTSIQFSPSATTTYTITASSNSCQTTTTVQIVVASFTNAVQIVSTQPTCINSADGSAAIILSPALPSATYHWLPTSVGNVNGGTVGNMNQGPYSVKIIDTISGACSVHYDTLVAQGNTCGSIIGHVAIDTNKNCIKDSLEPNALNGLINIGVGLSALTDPNGNFNFTGLAFGTYTVSNLGLPVNNLFPACSASQVITISSNNPAASVQMFDTLASAIDYNILTFGGSCLNYPTGNIYRNIIYSQPHVGSQYPAIIYAVFDSIGAYSSAIPAPSSINGDTAFWSMNIASLGSIMIIFNVTQNTPSGDVYTLKTGYKMYTGTDPDLANNSSYSASVVCTGNDPNDKQVSPSGVLPNGYIADSVNKLSYQIRFQNTGTYLAVNVEVRDTISDKLDISTMQVISASHKYNAQIIDDSIAVFKFPLIMLPDSNSDEPNSHGSIIYSISKKSSTTIGDQISNRASIYFDFNSPVHTNTVLITMYDASYAQTAQGISNSSCLAQCGNGSIIFSTNGGVAPFTSSIIPSCSTTVIGNGTVTNLSAGTYTLTHTDALGHAISTSVIITDVAPLIVQISSTASSGNILGTATASATGGSA
jgi:hypothetical protein